MNRIKELEQKGQALKQRIAKFGAPYGNKNAAGPQDGSGIGGDKNTGKKEKFKSQVLLEQRIMFAYPKVIKDPDRSSPERSYYSRGKLVGSFNTKTNDGWLLTP